MRIAINGLALTRTMTGIGRTTLHTLKAMLKRNRDDEFFLFLPTDAPDDLGLAAENLELVHTDVSLSQPIRSMLFEEFQLPLKLRGAKIDLYYAPSFLLPAFPGARTEVICVHDLAWRLLPALVGISGEDDKPFELRQAITELFKFTGGRDTDELMQSEFGLIAPAWDMYR